MSIAEKYMLRCLELAKCGIGNVAPNPMVGCVIVRDDVVIGEGFHQKFGLEHAEVNAINSVNNKELLRESTLYVNLEPCAHYGKTPPCANLIVKYNIPKVVIGCVDSFSEVAGKGIDKLKKEGINVLVGVLEKESLFLNRRFFIFHTKKRPFIILKWAQSIDRFIDKRTSANDGPIKISGALAHRISHKWRSEEAGIMVGTNTIKMDNPTLTVREVVGKNPLRITIDKNCKLNNNLNVFNSEAKTIVFNALEDRKINNIEFVKVDFTKNIVPQIMECLFKMEIQSVIIEGGTQLIDSFLELNLWDEARIFIADKVLYEGIKAPKIPMGISNYQAIDNDKLITIINQ